MTGNPRVLIVTPDRFAPVHGSGIMLSNLFADWSPEELGNLYARERPWAGSPLCSSYYQTTERIRSNPIAIATRFFEFATDRTESLDGIFTLRLTKALRDWLDGFQPNVIYSQVGTPLFGKLTLALKSYCGVPTVMHVMDDYVTQWPINGYASRNWLRPLRWANEANAKIFAHVVNEASARLAISPAMKDEYERRYGVDWITIANGINVDDWRTSLPGEGKGGSTFRLFFGGSVHENTNLDSLVDIVEAVQTLRNRDMDIRLEVSLLSPKHSDRLRRLGVHLVSRVEHAQIYRALRSYDMLVLPYNFDDASKDFIRFSWPTKLAEYLASGVPVLLYGPREIEFIDNAAREKWVFSVPERGKERIGEVLTLLAADRIGRAEIGDRGRRAALELFDMAPVAKTFSKILRGLAS